MTAGGDKKSCSEASAEHDEKNTLTEAVGRSQPEGGAQKHPEICKIHAHLCWCSDCLLQNNMQYLGCDGGLSHITFTKNACCFFDFYCR